MIPQIQWDKVEPFISSGGEPSIRYAISDREGVRLEMSMHDETIRGLVSEKMCFDVKSFPNNNAKVDPIIGGGFTALLKLGNANDEAGNLMLIRVTTASKFSTASHATIVASVVSTILAVGIHLDKNVMHTIRGN